MAQSNWIKWNNIRIFICMLEWYRWVFESGCKVHNGIQFHAHTHAYLKRKTNKMKADSATSIMIDKYHFLLFRIVKSYAESFSFLVLGSCPCILFLVLFLVRPLPSRSVAVRSMCPYEIQ